MNVLLYVGVGAVIAILFFAAYFWTADEMPQLETNNDKIRIYATFFPYYEFTKNIAGDRAETMQFISSNAQTHEWEPSAKKIQTLTEIDIFVYNGLGAESYVNKIIDSDQFNNIEFIKATDGIDLIKINDTIDPHMWLDPILVKKQVINIMNGLIKVDPINAQYYEKNAMMYNMKLDALDQKIISTLSTCNKNKIITYHNAFTYFADRYELELFSLGGLESENEFSSLKMIEFIEYAKNNDISVIFAEELVDPRLTEIIATEINGMVLFFNPLETISNQDASNGVTFIDKMEDNLAVLEKALECQ
ncbi:MAG: periplasmic solute-binding family protein [Cenarchaeum symbiont of Oopsacas minuta]|nr:periplasmic solute-binding family protein [Cenarchaeum symbiont of Oopsacas minuta]